MIERPVDVVELAHLAERVLVIEQRPVKRAGRIEHARQPDSAQRFEPIGVLHDFRLQGFRRDSSAEAVRLNGVRHRRDQRVRKVGEILRQNARGLFGGIGRSKMALGVIFRQVDHIVEVAGGEHDQRAGVAARHNALRAHPDTAQMGDIVRLVIMNPVNLKPAFEARLPE